MGKGRVRSAYLADCGFPTRFHKGRPRWRLQYLLLLGHGALAEAQCWRQGLPIRPAQVRLKVDALAACQMLLADSDPDLRPQILRYFTSQWENFRNRWNG